MTEESSASIDEVRALVAERLQFDEWLEALGTRRDKTPDHVFARVQGDYVARRATVMEQLHDYVPDLERLLAELDGRASSLAVRSQAEEDERAEAMLRHAVGEYDDAKWDDVRLRVESTLGTLGGEAEAIESHRNDVGSLLESARSEPDAAGDSSVTETASDGAAPAAHEADEPDKSDTAEWLGMLTPSDSEASQSGGEGSTAVTAAAAESEASDDASGSPSAAADDRSLPTDDDLELNSELPAPPAVSGTERTRIWGTPARSATPARGATPAKGAEAGRDGQTANNRDSEDVFGDARPADERRAASQTTESKDAKGDRSNDKPEAEFDELAFLRSVIEPDGGKPSLPRAPSKSEAQKTLRCTECSTMNLPTEWYCERCGGELAAF